MGIHEDYEIITFTEFNGLKSMYVSCGQEPVFEPSDIFTEKEFVDVILELSERKEFRCIDSGTYIAGFYVLADLDWIIHCVRNGVPADSRQPDGKIYRVNYNKLKDHEDLYSVVLTEKYDDKGVAVCHTPWEGCVKLRDYLRGMRGVMRCEDFFSQRISYPIYRTIGTHINESGTSSVSGFKSIRVLCETGSDNQLGDSLQSLIPKVVVRRRKTKEAMVDP